MSSTSEGSTSFTGRHISPIARSYKHPDGDAAGAVEDVRVATQNRFCNRDRGGRGEETGQDGACISMRRSRCQAGGHGLSPILSEGVGSSSSVGGDGRVAIAPGAVVTESAAVLKEVASNAGTGHSIGNKPARPDVLGHEGPACLACSQKLRAAMDRAQEGAHLSSSEDITRSSLLRASTTLETIAPLDDTCRSISFHSRVGGVFPGELFADARLPVSSPAEPRYGAYFAERENVRHGDGTGLRPPLSWQLPQQRRSRSAPTLGSVVSTGGKRLGARERRAGDMPRSPSPAACGVPPAVVGAWLAAAIEGIYHRNAGSGDISRSIPADLRTEATRSEGSGVPEGVPAFGVALDRDPSLARSPLTDLRRRRVSPTALAGEVRATGTPTKASHYGYARAVGTPAYAAGQVDSPPPRPPTLQVPLDNGDGDGGDGANEEEIFYQRQRLLQRVVSAAASYGGVMPAHTPADADSSDGVVEMVQAVGSTVEDECSRRHSDPLSWKSPPVAAETSMRGGPGALGGEADGRTAGGVTSAYRRRNTSGYWREKLGMTR